MKIFIRKWTLKVEIAFFSLVFFLSAVIVFIYVIAINCLFPDEFPLRSDFLGCIFYGTYTIGFVLYFVLKVMDTIMHFKIITHSKDEILNMLCSKNVVIKSDDVNEKVIKLESDTILFIESHKKNATIYFHNKDKVEKKTIRVTLKNVQEQLNAHKEFLRCHKSFIVNKNYIDEVLGNTRSAMAVLKHGIEIPVSRAKVGSVKAQIELLNQQ